MVEWNYIEVGNKILKISGNWIRIGERIIGPGQPCFVIAEAGVNHDGNVEKAKALIDIAVKAGADVVKFQTFKTDKLVTNALQKCEYQKVGDGSEGNYADMLKKLELNEEAHRELQNYASKKGILFMSTPFDEESADFLHALGVPAFKIDSGNLNNSRLVRHIASKMKPVILSTGMATIGEIDLAVREILSTGNDQLILLHCTSNYPPSFSDTNLKAIETMRLQFENIPIGYSDHTPGIAVSLAAVALGAVLIEKHFTIDKRSKGPDHLASLEPQELIELVTGIKQVTQSLGSSCKNPVRAEKEVADTLRRSVVSIKAIPKGAKITKEMVAIKRPGNGIPPNLIDIVIGRTAQKDIPGDSLINWDQV